MTDLELLECAQSVYDFLIDDTDIRLNKSFSSFNEIPVFKKMNETLVKYDFVKDSGVADMILFTNLLNSKYGIYDVDVFGERMKNDPKSFFSSTKSHDFYRTILRDLKLKLCLN
jgi:hypothetical protein